jgi:hypothetical protein
MKENKHLIFLVKTAERFHSKEVRGSGFEATFVCQCHSHIYRSGGHTEKKRSKFCIYKISQTPYKICHWYVAQRI